MLVEPQFDVRVSHSSPRFCNGHIGITLVDDFFLSSLFTPSSY
jgi:hypothetical protein